MTLRTPYDGAPFYCIMCGAGFYEFIACEESNCERECVIEAKRRQQEAQNWQTLCNQKI